MTDSSNQPSKADVQTTPLNKMPIPGQEDVEISEEEVAEAFKNAPNAQSGNQRQ
ncbi:hypothetical protein [Cohnella panacarvi]|uniref:hypothetical protein n=1 Tax=Cohnella panacarvi TaxID=400776 RepID=UPI0004AF27B3|nr:hypothetical protein [Cohnella panacarvi]